MTYIEMTKLCAEAMGLRLLPAYPPFHVLASGRDYEGLMVSKDGYLFIDSGAYDPLHDDAQAMALEKRFPEESVGAISDELKRVGASRLDINRCIVEIVAKMQAAKA